MTGRIDRVLEFRASVEDDYRDVFTPAAKEALTCLAPLDSARRSLMDARNRRRLLRAREGERISFLDPANIIPRVGITVQAARDGDFVGGEIPHDLECQWVQGTGPAARPGAPVERSIRNASYALLSGADGWMFDGEDALGQVSAMSLENQRCLKLAIDRNPVFLQASEQVTQEINVWAKDFLGRVIVHDWMSQLAATTVIFRPRGFHLDDRHVRLAGVADSTGLAGGGGFSASIVDTVLFVVNNYRALQGQGASLVLYLPKIETAEEAALWNEILWSLEDHLGFTEGTIKVYVLVERVEACFQLMEIRAALAKHFVGFNTGRWDYINSVSDALAWDPEFINPDIESVVMTYGYMRHYEDRVRRAVNTPDQRGMFALWQGGMEANIPVGSPRGVEEGMKRAVAGAQRERRAGASGKWVAHWKMVHIVRPVWEEVGHVNQLGRDFPPLTYTREDADRLFLLEPAPRTVRGVRSLISVGLQYGNAFLQGHQAAALKPADFFGDADVLYLMEDMATGEIRMSILWEWLHKAAHFTQRNELQAEAEASIEVADSLTPSFFKQLLAEEYRKLQEADDRNVHEDSKGTTLPIAREIVEAYVAAAFKPPWYIDFLNLNLGVQDLDEARRRNRLHLKAYGDCGRRITKNVDFD